MKKEIYPFNKQMFIKLKKFAKIIILKCREEKINPIIYGSFMLFYYTQNEKLKVNDLDFYVREKDFTNLTNILEKSQIRFKYSPELHTLQVFKGNLKLEFDSIDFWYKGRKELINIHVDGIIVKALNLKSLKSIYKRAYERSKDNSKGNRIKYELLARLR